MHLLRPLIAAVLSAFGTALVFAGVIALGRPVPPPPAPAPVREVTFEVQRRTTPPSTPQPPPPRRTAPKPVAPPTAALGASLSGLTFGLDTFEALAAVETRALEGGAGDVVMTEATVDQPPEPVSRVAPEYPARARAKGIEGFVNLGVLVGEDGVVREVHVLDAQPAGLFEDAAREAVRRWRFRPALYQGRPVPVRVQQALRFALE